MLYVASDHGGYRLKESLKKFMKAEGIKFSDLGPARFKKDDDYVDYAALVARKVSANPERDLGLLICRSGQGVAIVANKFKGVRAALCWNVAEAKMSRQDDMSNVICLPADYISPASAERVLDTWLTTFYSKEERHVRRVNKIKQLEKGK